MQDYPSIFNQALAPITPGPSSSNTCGPVRIAYACHQIMGEPLSKAVIEFSKDGAFPATYIGMRSDIAFINGFMGKLQTDPDFIHAYKNAQQLGLAVEFNIVDNLYSTCLEAARLILTGKSGKISVILGDSLGGGEFLIHSIDGCQVEIRGDQYQLLLFLDTEDSNILETAAQNALKIVERHNSYRISTAGGQAVIQISLDAPCGSAKQQAAAALPNVTRVCALDALHPVVLSAHRPPPPFVTPEEMVEYCQKNGCDAAQAAVDYEAAVSGWDKDKVRAYADELFAIIQNSAQKGLEGNFDMNGIVEPQAYKLKDTITSASPLSLGFLDAAIPLALGVMEYSNASGTIVCLPTGGSSGIVPAAILGAAPSLEATRRQQVDALLAAGLIGMCMCEDNKFSGGDYGCQAEVGCGAAMAAGALVQLMGGSSQMVCDAASIALQCQLGLICDPIAGLVQVPCLARNMSGVAIAAMAAKSVVAGFDAVIPLSEATRSMVEVGKNMSADLKGCGNAGCAKTATGRRLAQEQLARDNNIRK